MKDRSKALVVGYAVAALIVLLAWTCSAQVRYGIVVGPAHDTMVAHWQRVNEQAYCVVSDTVLPLSEDPADTGDTVYVLGVVRPAIVQGVATQDSINFMCPIGAPSVHTHPGNLSPDVADCNPSHKDWEALEESKVRYNVVQCGPNQFVFFFEVFNPVRKHTVFSK